VRLRRRRDGMEGQERGPAGSMGAAVSELPENGFLFIGELAKKTGSDPKTIRFYERADLLSPPRHGKFRTFLASDIRRLKNILMLRKMGVPIAQIRDLFELVGADSEILGNSKAVGTLRVHLDLLKSRQAEVADQ